MPTLLENLVLDEVSMVPDGASPGATIVIFKSRDQRVEELRKALLDTGGALAVAKLNSALAKAAEMTAETFAEIDDGREEQDKINRMVWSLGDSLRSIYADKSVEDKAALAEKSVQEFLAAVRECLGAKAEVEKTGGSAMSQSAALTQEQITKQINDAVAEATKTITKAAEEREAAIRKEASDLVAKAQKEAADAVTKSNEAVAKMAEERAQEQRIAKANQMIDGVPGFTAEGVALILKSGDEATVKALEASIAAIKKSLADAKLFQPVGAGGAGVSTDTDTAIAKAAEEVRKANPNLTPQQAVDKALQNDPALYARWKAENHKSIQ